MLCILTLKKALVLFHVISSGLELEMVLTNDQGRGRNRMDVSIDSCKVQSLGRNNLPCKGRKGNSLPLTYGKGPANC